MFCGMLDDVCIKGQLDLEEEEALLLEKGHVILIDYFIYNLSKKFFASLN